MCVSVSVSLPLTLPLPLAHSIVLILLVAIQKVCTLQPHLVLKIVRQIDHRLKSYAYKASASLLLFLSAIYRNNGSLASSNQSAFCDIEEKI